MPALTDANTRSQDKSPAICAAFLALALASPASAEDAFTYTTDLAEIIAMSAMTLDTPEAFNQALAKAIPDHPPLEDLVATVDPDAAGRDYWVVDSTGWDIGRQPALAPRISCIHFNKEQLIAARTFRETGARPTGPDVAPLLMIAHDATFRMIEEQTGVSRIFPEDATGAARCTFLIFSAAAFEQSLTDLTHGLDATFTATTVIPLEMPLSRREEPTFLAIGGRPGASAQTGFLTVTQGEVPVRTGETVYGTFIQWFTFDLPGVG